MTEANRTLLFRIAGVILFAAGLLVAGRTLPEWMVRDTPSRSEAKQSFDEIARSAGYEPTSTQRNAVLKFGPSSDISIRNEASDQYGAGSRRWLENRGLGLIATVEGTVSHPSGMQGVLNISSDLNGNTIAIEFTTANFGDFIKPGVTKIEPDEYRETAGLLLRPDETLGEARQAQIGAQTFVVFPVEGASPAESITITRPPGIILLNRRPGSPSDIQRLYDEVFTLSRALSRGLATVLRFVVSLFFVVLFIALVVKRNLGLRTGMTLGAIVFATGALSGLSEVAPGWLFWLRMLFSVLAGLWTMILWSSSESWLRTVQPGLVQTMDTIASFRPGPRSAHAVADGWFAGLGLSGVVLLLEVIPTVLGQVSASSAALHLSIFGVASPVSRAVALSAAILAATAAAHFFTGRTERILGVALAVIFVIPAFRVGHWALTIAASLVVAVLLRNILARGGVAAVLSAALTLHAAPSALFAVRHSGWMPYAALASTALVVLPVVFALVGRRRPAENETQQIVTPRFMRRLEEERRVRFEMGLLAEMQLKMLPDSSPRLDGWDIAAHSVLASEVGGDLYDYLEDEEGNLWIAIGDVSGHGYQCAIAQAMTKASLTSLVAATLAPSDVLARIDKVLRRGGSSRTFTSLALAKLDPRSGTVILSNAGNPYPVHVTVDGRVSEVEMPSLPLGMGPARTYENVELQLGHRDYLLFFSDGLPEVRNREDEMLGFEKPASLLRMRRGQTAAEIVGGLEKAWRDHLDGEEVQDDTTIVVIRRE